jgi:glutamate racemase
VIKNSQLHLVITDSGLGGLAICSEIERNLRHASRDRNIRLTYFNAWPDPRSGYNDLPDMNSRARVFDQALRRMDHLQPDRILIACNTLSILYRLTEHSRTTTIPVSGIIEAGVELFYQALVADPLSAIAIFGTRTTIESRIHRDRLAQKGIEDFRMITTSCHGLAAAIEKDPDSPTVIELMEKCMSQACRAGLPGTALYAGLCCTHYAYIKDAIRTALERFSGRSVRVLDPNQRMADQVAPRESEATMDPAWSRVAVELLSKVKLDETQRRALAKRIEAVSPITAQALLSYTHKPDLF